MYSNQMSRRKVLQVGGMSALGALIASCTSGGPTEGPSVGNGGRPVRGGDLIFATNLDIATLDPAFSQNFSERFAYYAMFNTLVGYDQDFNIVPELAQRWELEQDGQRIVFHLQPGVKFHDGTNCDASAVKWNLDRIMAEETNSPLRALLADPVKAVRVLDERTVSLELERPWRPLLAALGERPGFIASPAAVERYGQDFGRNPVGSGPFQFERFTPGSELVMRRFNGYWEKGKPYLDSITMRHTADQQVQIAMMRADEAHIMDQLSPQLAVTMQGAQGVSLKTRETGDWYASQMDVDKPPFDDLRLRQAISLATNREGAKKVLFRDEARIATGPIGLGWAHEPGDSVVYPFDLQQAKAKVAQAGAEGLSVDYINSSEGHYQEMAQLLFGSYSKIGLNVNAGTVPGSDYYTQVVNDQLNWSVTKWTPRADPDGLLRILFHSNGFQNTTGYSNPKVDQLLDQAAGIFDTAAASKLYQQVNDIVERDAPYAWTVWPNIIVPHRETVQGLKLYGDSIYRLAELWLAGA